MKIKFENSIYIYLFISAILMACVALLLTINDQLLPKTSAVIPKLELPADSNKAQYTHKLPPGFPDFPTYPGAVLEKSYKLSKVQDPKRGFEAYWKTDAPVPEVMNWYLKELAKANWSIDESPSDPETVGEQVAHVSKNGLKVTVGIEQEGPTTTEIYISVPAEPDND